ncbi:CPBP family intramembrane metalloprotease [Aestuariimicrobium sp. p3-SID1156]|uniref:CPBP family intramembrane glutamic endopeptidase n=1 Tax=Aestuariimicrobium sp. p3-SID1156 TaxID=2916038 RepID=UPI00223C3CF0|nr:CPBP family intramembrane glutamic endopeptidase [Aestuariimicrobium sp. p3-SID1156]MCT1459643.1 CPBP family intramembrane metalloprotease [Aestuariimicrobium sp. p3-SID1156]
MPSAAPVPSATSIMLRRVPWTPVLLHFALTIAFTFGMAAPFLLGPFDPELIGAVVPFAMWVPALVSLLTNRLWRQGPIRELWAVGPKRAWQDHEWRSRLGWPLALAVAIMLGVPIVQLALAMAFGVTDWSPRSGLLGALIATPLVLLMQLLFATGEELGWRGYLQTLLAPLGFWPMALFLSAVWVAFHSPAALALWASGEGYHATLLYLGDIFAIGLVFSALRLIGASVWPVVLAHALLNSGRVLLMQNFTTPELDLAVADQWTLHAIGWALFAAVAVWLSRKPVAR